MRSDLLASLSASAIAVLSSVACIIQNSSLVVVIGILAVEAIIVSCIFITREQGLFAFRFILTITLYPLLFFLLMKIGLYPFVIELLNPVMSDGDLINVALMLVFFPYAGFALLLGILISRIITRLILKKTKIKE